MLTRICLHLLERLWPYGAATFTVWLLGRYSYAQKLEAATELVSPVLNVFAIIVGFIAAVVTFLLTTQGLKSLEEMRTTKAFHLLIDYHWQGIFLGFAASTVSLVLLAFAKKSDHVTFHHLFNLWAWLGVASILAFIRVFVLLKLLLKPPALIPKT